MKYSLCNDVSLFKIHSVEAQQAVLCTPAGDIHKMHSHSDLLPSQ